VTRGVIGEKHVGHGGTLDPAATGLLPVLIGSATKIVTTLHGARKVYAAWIRFGTETTTDDAAGTPTRSAGRPAREDAERALSRFRGVIQQRPPAYAAVKVDGRRSYDRAREGDLAEPAAREVQVFRIDMARWTEDDLAVLVVCSSGTYVRSIARDVGREAGSAAHLAALRRLAVGALDVRDAIGIEALRGAGREAALARIRPFSVETLVLDDRYLSQSADKLVPKEGGS
jgi:tRNA pseudouridine55 synthase